MDIALLLVVNCKFDIINRIQLHDIVTVYIVTCSNLVLYYQFIHKHFVHKRIKPIDEVKLHSNA